MKKRLLSLTAACLLWGNFGCQTVGRDSIPPLANQSRQDTPSDARRSTPGSAAMGKTASEQTNGDKRYFSQDGATTSRRQVKAESASGATSSYRPGSPSDAGQMVKNGEPSVDVAPDKVDFKATLAEPLSTFSADVDTASYTNLRRSLLAGTIPYSDQIRIEEMINYFPYNLAEPQKGQPFSLTSELSECPWRADAKLLRLAIKTQSIPRGKRPPCNLVFLLDVSGSMGAPDKLPLLKSSLKNLVDTLDDSDRIAIVTYAGSSGLVLPSTPGDKRTAILQAIDQLDAGGSTNGASGIELAYKVAQDSASEHSVNRVILATDGDFNVGVSSQDGLKKLIEEKRKSGLFLSVLGFGGSRAGDKTMETLADEGNGNYAAIDSLQEARKVLVEESGANLVTVAKDVKFQVAFNPRQVGQYRLLGYENRRLTNQQFDDDSKDAGDLGAGHAVTVLYELVPPKEPVDLVKTVLDEAAGNQPNAKQLALVKLRYKAPNDDASDLIEVAVMPDDEPLSEASPDHRWAVAVTEFGLRLKGDPETKSVSYAQIEALAESGIAKAGDPYRLEFLQLVAKAKALDG